MQRLAKFYGTALGDRYHGLLKNGSKLEVDAQMAARESTRGTELCDRRGDVAWNLLLYIRVYY
ncbi:MAG: hypothetical protein M9921_14430 [Fimbriimonadaceae bacterium]|nr:hypothetical protein [Chthonomonadaceae bacterium]MCO5298041.1 hypothetical protein [Fimbriimonadaceae bacterium]